MMSGGARDARPAARLHPDAAELAADGRGARRDAIAPLAPDLPGHGRCGERRPASFAAVRRLRARAGRRAASSSRGYSMGGRIALHAALARAERVRRLRPDRRRARASPTRPSARRAAAPTTRSPTAIEAIGDRGVRRREWGALPLFAGQPARVRAAAHADRLRNDAGGLAAALRGLGTGAMDAALGPPRRAARCRSTLVAGERDAKFRALGERMAAAHPRGRRSSSSRAPATACPLEAPQAVAAASRGIAHSEHGHRALFVIASAFSA